MTIISHVSIGTNDLIRALAFYDRVMASIGCKRIFEVDDVAVAYGRDLPEFWVGRPDDESRPADAGNGVHFAFAAASKQTVDDFHAAALAAGASDDGAPGPRPQYGAGYYGAFVHDLDGHKIEAMFWDADAE